MSKLPPFVCATSVTNTVDLLSDSSDDEDLCGTPSFARRPSGDDEDEVDDDNKDDEDDDDEEDDVQVVMVKELVSRVKTMPQSFAAFTKTKGKAPEKISKSKQNWIAQLEEATLYYEKDPSFALLSINPGPPGCVYRWLRTQNAQMEMYRKFLFGGGTHKEWDQKAAKCSSLLASYEIRSLSPMLEAFATREGVRKSDNKRIPKTSNKPVFFASHHLSGTGAPRSHFHVATFSSPHSHHKSSFPS
jgi:hypothetical protein